MRRPIHPCVYILASRRNGTLYTGVTGNLVERMRRHLVAKSGFCAEYNVRQLVYFEAHGRIEGAIMREKRIKRWRRVWKLELIETVNPEWDNLWTPLESKRLDLERFLVAPSR